MRIDEEKLDRIMLELGHRENLLGTEYLRECVRQYAKSPGRLNKAIYPVVAEAKGTTAGRLERDMRHSIETAWKVGSTEAQFEYFGWSVDPVKCRPTVGEFIARMARLCRED